MIATVLAFTFDLTKGVTRTPIKPLMALSDKAAHIFQVSVLRDGVPETLTGIGCSGTFIRADDASITLEGSVEGNVASVTLNEACYRVAGKCKITIKLSTAETISTVFIGDGSVMTTSTDTIVDEENIIPSLEDIIAQQQASIAAANAANTAAGAANDAAEEATTAASTANAAAANATEKAQEADAAADRANNAAKAAEDVVEGKLPFFDGTPSAPGEAAAGVSTLAARGDHVHPLPSLLPVENGGTGETSVGGIKQSLKAFSIVGAATDANTAVKIGLYGTTPSTANLPSGTSHGNLFSVSSSYEFNNQTGIIDQFFFPIGGGKIWRRSNYNDQTWSSWTLVALDAYPVGSIYMSYEPTSPASLFGGTWTQIQNRFLVGVGSSYAAGDTGGEATHKLTVNELPSHSHNYFYPGYEAGGEWYGASGTAKGNTVATTAVGGGAAHENRPPYFAVYIWRRTA